MADEPTEQQRIDGLFHRVLSTPDGAMLLAHWRKTTIDNIIGPRADAEDLRIIEAERRFVTDIERRVARGGAK